MSSGHENGNRGRGIANGSIISLQSEGSARYQCNMVHITPNTLAGERAIDVSTQIFRVGWISSTCGQTLFTAEAISTLDQALWGSWSQDAPLLSLDAA